MGKINKSQIISATILAVVLLTPLLPSSLRPKYLYFIINLIIIALGAESGLLSCLFTTQNLHLDPKNTPPTHGPTESNSCHSTKVVVSVPNEKSSSVTETFGQETTGLLVNNIEEKVIMEKCPSKPSIFFIGSLEVEGEHQEEFFEDISGQELFAKAETFIGNFYKQLKIQREDIILEKDSWLLS